VYSSAPNLKARSKLGLYFLNGLMQHGPFELEHLPIESLRARWAVFSYRLTFGESDGVAGLVTDLFESSRGAVPVVQCHSAGADHFIFWLQQWFDERMGVTHGIIRNDLDVRKKENAEQKVTEWGDLPHDTYALEGGVRFFADVRKGQKTGYFYDHRDNRAEMARRSATTSGDILDCFSYTGSWGLQALKRNSKARLTAVDVSASALDALKRNASENGFGDRVEALEMDFFKDKHTLSGRNFGTVICDPPALTSSAKHAAEGKRAHEACFYNALGYLAPGGVAALASCSYHLTWEDFTGCVQRAGLGRNRQLKITQMGSQSADHPVLATSVETRYLKNVIVEELDRFSAPAT
jgi:23S rRNA (cytosine1962-C5)-methyltransferase